MTCYNKMGMANSIRKPVVSGTHKECVKCWESLSLDKFSFIKESDRTKAKCKLCYILENEARVYSISEDELVLLKSADSCQICLTKSSSTRMHIDHDHTTGKVRGYICGSCNTSIGVIAESSENMARSVEYLAKDFSRISPDFRYFFLMTEKLAFVRLVDRPNPEIISSIKTTARLLLASALCVFDFF